MGGPCRHPSRCLFYFQDASRIPNLSCSSFHAEWSKFLKRCAYSSAKERGNFSGSKNFSCLRCNLQIQSCTKIFNFLKPIHLTIFWRFSSQTHSCVRDAHRSLYRRCLWQTTGTTGLQRSHQLQCQPALFQSIIQKWCHGGGRRKSNLCRRLQTTCARDPPTPVGHPLHHHFPTQESR